MVVPSGSACYWSSAASRKLYGNCGCAIYGVGTRAELMIRWDVPRIGQDEVVAVLGAPGAFSCITMRHMQQQLREPLRRGSAFGRTTSRDAAGGAQLGC